MTKLAASPSAKWVTNRELNRCTAEAIQKNSGSEDFEDEVRRVCSDSRALDNNHIAPRAGLTDESEDNKYNL